MKRYIYIAYALMLVLAACQDDKLGDHENSGNATLTLNFNSSDNTLSRAVSSDEDEQIISNAYVFVFNQDGSKVFGQFYNNIHQSKTYTTKVENIPAGNGKTIAVIANINTTIHDLNDTKLDAVTSKADLLALTSHMQGKYIERGIQFLMSGMKEGAELIANQNNTIDIPLTRTDAKVRFNVQTKEGVTFTPREWKIVAIPREVSVLPNTTQGQFEFENYFNSEWNNFEISTTNAITFAFYIPENKVNPKETIPAEGEYRDQYALREKQEKTPNADGSVTNGAYRYADQRATYVKLKGNVFYSIGGGQENSADGTYTIHLGGVNGVNDYNSLRNHFYTYTVTINSVEDIIVEVESTTGEEPSPGSEGDVVVAGCHIGEAAGGSSIALRSYVVIACSLSIVPVSQRIVSGNVVHHDEDAVSFLCCAHDRACSAFRDALYQSVVGRPAFNGSCALSRLGAFRSTGRITALILSRLAAST